MLGEMDVQVAKQLDLAVEELQLRDQKQLVGQLVELEVQEHLTQF